MSAAEAEAEAGRATPSPPLPPPPPLQSRQGAPGQAGRGDSRRRQRERFPPQIHRQRQRRGGAGGVGGGSSSLAGAGSTARPEPLGGRVAGAAETGAPRDPGRLGRQLTIGVAMQRPSGQGAAFSIDSLIGHSPPAPRSGPLLYTGYPMFMPYRPLVLPHGPLQTAAAGLPPLAPLASFAGRLTNSFCASLGQAVPSMVALTTALPSFGEPPDAFYPAQEVPAAGRGNAEPPCRRRSAPESLEADDLPPGRDKAPPEPSLHFPEGYPSLAAGK